MKKSILLVVCIILQQSCTRSDMERGALCLELGDYERAYRCFEHVLDRNPAHPVARLGMGKALLQRSVDMQWDTLSWRRALMHFEVARSLGASRETDGLLSEAWTERTQGLLRRSDTLGALEALTRAIEYTPHNAELLNLAGILYFRMGKVEQSKAIFTRAIHLDTLNPSSLFNLGMIDWSTGQFESAHQRWLAALRRAPHDEELLYWFARAEKQKREHATQAEHKK